MKSLGLGKKCLPRQGDNISKAWVQVGHGLLTGKPMPACQEGKAQGGHFMFLHLLESPSTTPGHRCLWGCSRPEA